MGDLGAFFGEINQVLDFGDVFLRRPDALGLF
jgi:hypothetical protein